MGRVSQQERKTLSEELRAQLEQLEQEKRGIEPSSSRAETQSGMRSVYINNKIDEIRYELSYYDNIANIKTDTPDALAELMVESANQIPELNQIAATSHQTLQALLSEPTFDDLFQDFGNLFRF